MADGAGGRVVISTSLLLAVLVATSWCVVAAASTPAGGSAHDQAAGAMNGGDRGTLARSRFLVEQTGRRTCGGLGHPPEACSGTGAGGGAAGEQHRLFRCCGGACTDVLASASNCGACGRRCPFGRLCCGGRCAAVAYDVANCGVCGRACAAGTACTYGMCGYA
ncbi:unnamed protein product [Urochloa humidicola]